MKKQNPTFTRKHLIYFPILHIIKRYKDVMNVKLEEFFANKKLLRKIIKKILLIITFTVALIFALFNFDRVWGFITGAISLAAPFFIGIAIAFVVNVLLKFYEEKAFAFLNKRNGRIWKKIRRGVCIFLSFLTFVLVIGGIILFVVPELVNSVKVLTDNAPSYINRLMQETTKLLEKWNVTQEQINALKLDWSSILTQATQVTTNFMGSVFNITVNVANGIFIMAMSFIFCMYMLVNKEKLTTNLKRVMYAYLPNRVAKRTIDVAILSNKIFSNFVRGQLTEACIWFFLIYLGMTVLRLPYALLISAIVALCSLIPIIGPYISMFTAGFILLLVNPWHTLTYLIFFLILQQIEGNLIYPRVVGTSIGLPGIWVLLAIILCGNLFGMVGILLGIPTFSVIYTLLRGDTSARLRKKRLTTEQILRNSPYEAHSPDDPEQTVLEEFKKNSGK